MTKLKLTASIELSNGDKVTITNHVKSRKCFVQGIKRIFPKIKSIKIQQS